MVLYVRGLVRQSSEASEAQLVGAQIDRHHHGGEHQVDAGHDRVVSELGEGMPATGAARGSVATGPDAGAPAAGTAAPGSVDGGLPAGGPAAAGLGDTRGVGSAPNRGAQRVAALGREQGRRDITGSAQNQPPPQAGGVGSRTQAEQHLGVRARLPGGGAATRAAAPESARAGGGGTFRRRYGARCGGGTAGLAATRTRSPA